MKSKLASILALLLLTAAGFAQPSARVIKYHANDIVAVNAKMRYTTLIQLQDTEKILEVATGDKDFWIIDVVGNYCFLHPAKEGIHSNLNLITDKGNVYSFVLDEVGDGEPDLKLVIEPSNASVLGMFDMLPKFAPFGDVLAAQHEAKLAQTNAADKIEQFRSEYPTKSLRFDYTYRDVKPFGVSAIYQDGQFTYIKSSATEKFSIYELKDGKPNLINFQLKDGTYVVGKVIDRGYLEIGKHRLNFQRAGE